MTATTTRRTGSGRRIRDLQRLAHLAIGAALAAYVYLPGGPSPALAATVRWVLLPLLAASGVVMWQWPKIRRWARSQESRS